RPTRGPMTGRGLRVLDLATGSGAIAVSLARYLAPEIVVATDVSEAAAALARDNASLNGVADVVAVVVAEGLAAFRDAGTRSGFDVVVCNPPYVATGEIEGLQPEVRDYEPRVALDGGASGLDFFAGVLPDLPSILRGPGVVAFEIGAAQAAEVSAIFSGAGLGPVEVVRDLAGRDRIVLVTRG
ncbi:MAG: methyltransferase, partial [bacterium]